MSNRRERARESCCSTYPMASTAGRDKRYAVAQILREVEEDVIVASKGDDYTDEDAFRAISERGLSILVRSEYRWPTADLRLKPPGDCVRFLDAWAVADRKGGSS